MNDMHFNFLVKVAQTKPEERQDLVSDPTFQVSAKALGSVSKEVLEILLGNRQPGSVAKAWLSLVMQAAEERTAREMDTP